MLANFIDFLKQWFENFATTWGNNQLVSGLILLLIGGACGVLFNKLLPLLWKQLVRFISWSRAKLRGQEPDHHFELFYLDRMTPRHA
jgi:hypothetical protein